MVPFWFMLPLPSCLVAIGSLVHCVMFSLVIVLSWDYQFCVLIGWFLSCVQSCLLQVAMSLAVSQYQVRKVRTCILGSSDFASSTQECELPRTGGHKSGNSANGTAAYLIISVSSPPVIYTVLQYNEISNTLPLLFSCKHINSHKNVVRGTCMHYSETKYYIKQRCLFSVSLKTWIATKNDIKHHCLFVFFKI